MQVERLLLSWMVLLRRLKLDYFQAQLLKQKARKYVLKLKQKILTYS